ncbi:hypothetical protein OQA88_2367 [Cercophora sp. LCS_1]
MKLTLLAASAILAFTTAAPTPEPILNNSTLSARGTDAPYGIKKGLAYNNGAITDILSRPGSATWAYNWGAAQHAPKFQQIPMYWGPGNQGDVNGIHAKINAGDTPWVLGYNEPDVTREHGGCNASPRQAFDAWGNDMWRFAERGPKLVCPAVSSWDTDRGHTGGPSGLTWLRQFVGFARDPNNLRCGAQALHWYGEDGRDGRYQADLFIRYVERAHGVVNDIFRKEMDLWITEFAPLPIGNVQIMADFLDVVIPWLDRAPYVARYSPFMAEHLVSNGQLNVAGNMFVNRRG